MKIIKVSNVEKFAIEILPKQPQNDKIVKSILNDVKKNGDAAIKRYEKKFTGASLSSLRVSDSEIKKAYSIVSEKQLAALRMAKNNLEKMECNMKSMLKKQITNNDGIKITKNFIPIKSVGCYIPGGQAKYPSSAIMSVVPAKVAGVKRIIVVSPPDADGAINPQTIVAANMCGADEIYKTGGVQSIAALSFGTKSISKVDKIVGPGGAFVTTAKFLVSQNTGIDMLAGPTEIGIVADNSANPEFIALDLISQAEHSSDTICYLITNSQKLACDVNKNISKQISKIKRKKLVTSSLSKNGFIAICKSVNDIIKLANELAPEHLEIMTRDPAKFASKITSSGLVLLGNYTPSAASDYILGSNHILPTSGFGKTRGQLSVLDFLKVNTQISTSRSLLSKFSKHLDVLTDAEDLPNHYNAIRGRIK